jgi:hypothetical protein
MMAMLRLHFQKEIPMRGLLLGGLAVVIVSFGAPSQAADETYDLRGPAPKKGQVFVSSMTLRIKDADTTLKGGGQNIDLKMTMDQLSEEEQKVLAVDGRLVTKCQSKITKDRADIVANLGGMAMKITHNAELEGETVISERVGENKWKHSLVDTKPTDKQKKELDTRNGIESEDDLYPAEKVKVGHTWKVEAKALTKVFGNSFTDIKGELNQKFLKIEDVDNDPCAVIESTGTIKGKMKDDDGQPTMDVEMELKVLSWRSIKTGVEVKGKFDGKIKLEGTQKMDDQDVEIKLSGPISGESTTKLK